MPRQIVHGALSVLTLVVASSAWSAAAPWVPNTTGNVGPAPTTFNKWEAIEAPASSGASCGNGSPYRFFVNRTTNAANAKKTVIMFEGGGACWEQNACQMKGGLLGATNYNGIPTNYMSTGLALGGLITPFTSRTHPLQKVQTQSWNIVYVPYCTGDVHTGNKVATYGDADPANPITYYHRGFKNGEAVANWVGRYLPKQDKLLVTGFSAGGVGATAMYGLIRLADQPKQSAMLADSGPLFQVDRNASPEEAPSVLLHNKIRVAWGLDGDNGLASRMIATFPTAGTVDNLGSLTTGLAKVFPQDRLGYAVFQADAVFSSFSYTKFYPEIAAVPAGAKRDALLKTKWVKEIGSWVDAMKPYANTGYYIPYGRDFIKAHTLTTASFAGTGIKEANLADLGVFVDNLLDPNQPLNRAYETQRTTPNPSGIALISWINTAFYALFGI